ncbi:unnamed protein product [Schistosoma margrebowiei]|uniref:Uncharacterized protein n=1 Tax=Schistosoma margrebowiei TaxID=48269 RepID=A0A183NBM1_9TREM|nr:unnamed protein product [Schistosoma margrebowiei]
MKVRLKKYCTTGETALQRFNIAFLRDTDKLNEFKIGLNSRFQALQDLLKEETTMDSIWKAFKKSLNSTYHEVLSFKKHYHKEWISMGTLDKTQVRKSENTAINNSRTGAEKFKAQVEYTEANKQVKKSIEADKQKYVEKLATTAE